MVPVATPRLSPCKVCRATCGGHLPKSWAQERESGAHFNPWPGLLRNVCEDCSGGCHWDALVAPHVWGWVVRSSSVPRVGKSQLRQNMSETCSADDPPPITPTVAEAVQDWSNANECRSSPETGRASPEFGPTCPESGRTDPVLGRSRSKWGRSCPIVGRPRSVSAAPHIQPRPPPHPPRIRPTQPSIGSSPPII